MTGQPETPRSERIHLEKAKRSALADLCKARPCATEGGRTRGLGEADGGRVNAGATVRPAVSLRSQGDSGETREEERLTRSWLKTDLEKRRHRARNAMHPSRNQGPQTTSDTWEQNRSEPENA